MMCYIAIEQVKCLEDISCSQDWETSVHIRLHYEVCHAVTKMRFLSLAVVGQYICFEACLIGLTTNSFAHWRIRSIEISQILQFCIMVSIVNANPQFGGNSSSWNPHNPSGAEKHPLSYRPPSLDIFSCLKFA